MTGLPALVADGVMLLGAADGSLRPDGGPAGLFAGDTRCLSRWELVLDGYDLQPGAEQVTTSTRRVVLVPVMPRNVPAPFVVVREQEVDGAGLRERVTLRSTGPDPLDVTVRLAVEADFADQFGLRSDRTSFDRSAATCRAKVGDGCLGLAYEHVREGRTWSREVAVVPDTAPARITSGDDDTRVDDGAVGGELRWRLQLPARGDVAVSMRVQVVGRPTAAVAAPVESSPVESSPVESSPVEPSPVEPSPVEPPSSGSDLLGRSLADLDALTMPCPGRPDLRVPAAGVPWFLALFGRDSLVSAVLAQPERPELLGDVVRALVAHQGKVDDPLRGEQPGRIVHEVRDGELASLGYVPYGRYYGTVDATSLFLAALGRVPEVSAAPETEAAARAAVDWLAGPGGLGQHGFVRYSPDPQGLLNQGWKDSADALVHADGTLARGSIALCEVQAYTWQGLRETARLARTVWDDPAWARELDQAADALRRRFLDAFWMPAHDVPALALDGDGRQVDVVASNAGHLLWTGILDDGDAERLARRLLEPDVHTGWGLRTLAAGQRPYSPTSYHNGSVWPHDTMVAATGMAEYGLHDEARAVAGGIRDAAATWDHRLPELFAGFSRDEIPVPVRYAHAASPQAWAAAAGVVAARLLSPS